MLDLLADDRRRFAPHLGSEGDILRDGEVGEQGIGLENHGDVALLGWKVVGALAADLEIAAEIDSSPAIIRIRVDFPQPDGPTMTTNSPSLMLSERSAITSI